MSKILYLTNCSAGIFDQVPIWNISKFIRSRSYLRNDFFKKNLSHYLCDMGHEVDFLVNSFPKIQPTDLTHFDSRAKLINNPDTEIFFEKLCGGIEPYEQRYFACPNIFTINALSEIINLNKYDAVVIDSRTELAALKKNFWHKIFQPGLFEPISKCVDMHNIINWIDSPGQTKELKEMGESKLFYNLDLLKTEIRKSLAKIDNLFPVMIATSNKELQAEQYYPRVLIEALKTKDIEKIKSLFFSKIPNSIYRYHSDQFIEEDFFKNSSIFGDKFDLDNLFKRFPLTSALRTKAPKSKEDSIFNFHENTIALDKSLSEDNFNKYYLGTQRYTNEGYRSLAQSIDSAVS